MELGQQVLALFYTDPIVYSLDEFAFKNDLLLGRVFKVQIHKIEHGVAVLVYKGRVTYI